MKVTILAKGSGAEPYEVEFNVDGNSLAVFCNCQAGNFGRLCKHKTELLMGEQSRLFSDAEIPRLEQVRQVVRNTPEIVQLAGAIAESERIVKTEQTKLRQAKKRLETALKRGVPIAKT